MPELLIDIEIVSTVVYFATLTFLVTGLIRLKPGRSKIQPSVTVVVAAHNEENTISQCILSLVEQIYTKGKSQSILVDDRSEDRTGEIMLTYSQKFPEVKFLKIARTPSGISPKKHALEQAIQQAPGDLIFTTDADCTPPPHWLEKTIPYFTDDVGVVIGPAPLKPGTSLLSKILALNYFADAFLTAGAAGWNVAVTCTGRNLTYRKKVFEEVNGFETIKHSLSGDDDLFLQLVKKRTHWNISFCLDHETAVPSSAVNRFSDYVRQRKRHVSASRYYSKPLQIAFLIFNGANLYLYVFSILALCTGHSVKLAFVMLALKFITDFCALHVMTSKFNRLCHLRYFLHWEAFYLLNQILVSPLGLFGKAKWNSR